MTFKWEVLDDGPPALRRARTPRGWIVAYGTAALIEVYDPDGAWLPAPPVEPPAPPPVVVPPVVPPIPPPPVVVPPVAASAVLGTNLHGVDDWESEQPFANLFRQSRAWMSSDGAQWDDGRPIDVDADGNVRSTLPGQQLRTIFYWGLPRGSHPTGEHLLTWTGSGTFKPFQGATIKSQSPNRIVLDVTGPFGVLLSGVNAAHPPRGLSLMVATNKDMKWSDAFLASLAPYGCIRFMDWQRTNGNDATPNRIVNVTDLPSAKRLRFDSTSGVALEEMIDLCNQLGVRPWFCIPHQATNATVLAMADIVKLRLRSDLGVFVEYSNEVWNNQFPQAAYAQAQGVAAKLHSTDAYASQLLFHARRTQTIGSIWRSVLLPGRVTVVLGAQSGATYWMNEMLGSLPAGAVDAIAIAPYFGGSLGSKATTPAMSVDQLMVALEAAVATIGPAVAAAKAIADKFHVRLLAYEAGQHLVGLGSLREDVRLNTLFDTANEDPRMETVYARYLQAWAANNPGALLCHFTNTSTWSKFGRWGSMRHPTDLQSPKRKALVAFSKIPR